MDNRASNQREDIGLRTAGDVPTEGKRSQERPEDITVGSSQRYQAAQAAFFANAEVAAATPRQSVWTGGNPLARDQEAELPTSSAAQFDENMTPDEPNGVGVNNESDWRPSLAIGSINTDRLSAREAARRYVLQWDHIWEYNKVHYPHTLHGIEEQRAEARREYQDICARNNAEDNVPRNQLRAFREERIEARVALLRQTLEEADPEGTEPMRRNIAAALNGYATGALGFSNTYALIYAGQIVDTSCTSHAEFTVDRQDRLDRYFAQHGPGYLWWEPPLARGKERVAAKKGTVLGLEREDDTLYHQHAGGAKFRDDSCHFKISLGFQNDNSLRCRKRATTQLSNETGPKRKWEFVKDFDNQPPTTKKHTRSTNINITETSGEPAKVRKLKILPPSQRTADSPPPASVDTAAEPVKEEDTGPAVFFDMLLDSGAEVPILLHHDFRALGYTEKDMNAATVVQLNAAAGQNSTALCFELLVGLDLHQGSSSSSSSPGGNDLRPVGRRHYFFPTRVVKLRPAIKPPPSGGYSGERLSGILPFLAYYVSSAPGRDEICIGDERADVLGTQKMPAGLRYDPFRNPEIAEQARELFQQAGPLARLRKVTFEHEMQGGRNLIDRDTVGRGSKETRTKWTLLGANRRAAASWEMDSVHQSKGRWESVEY